MDTKSPLLISVVLCTYNPRRDYLALALRSLGGQKLSYEQFEVLVVDNNSQPSLAEGDLSLIAGRSVTVVGETRQGLTFARIAGVRAAHADLVVFVDDDNELDCEYLEEVVRISRAHPQLGTYGGRTNGRLEKNVGASKRSLLPYLGVRDSGNDRIEGSCAEWGPWEPIGAGLVARRDVAEAYSDFVEGSAAGMLGRKGSGLMSGEDTLMTRMADTLGYSCAYEPALTLNHYISAGRLKWSYLFRLLYGHGCSYVVLARLLGRSVELPKRRWRSLIGNFIHRLQRESLTAAITMISWDLGFLTEAYSARSQSVKQES